MPGFFEIIMSLLSAIAIFMFGMKMMCDGLENVAQEKLKGFFNKAIKNPYMGALVGLIVAGVIQSSTATTVMVVGFVNAGLMNLAQSVGVIIGANVGTTLTGQMMAIRISDYIPHFLTIGTALFLFLKKEKARESGRALLGFGMLLLGMRYMSQAMVPVAQSDFFQNLILMLEGNIFLGVFVGFLMAGILNSSTAAKAIIMSLAATGYINLSIGIPLVLGTNIGTTITALISGMSANRNAKKAAMIHLIYNLVSVVIFLPFTQPFSTFIDGLGGEAPQQIANIHTFFNIASAIVLLPFSKLLIKIVDFLVKGQDEEVLVNRLDKRFLETPAVAFDQAFKQTLLMYKLARKNLQTASKSLISQRSCKMDEINEVENQINELEREITSFIVSIPRRKNDTENFKFASMVRIISDIERIGDHSKNIAQLACEAIEVKAVFSDEAKQELQLLLDSVTKAVDSSFESYKNNNYQKAEETLKVEEHIDMLEDVLRDKHIERLNANTCSAHGGAIFLDAISNFERIGDHSVNIAESIIKSQKVLT